MQALRALCLVLVLFVGCEDEGTMLLEDDLPIEDVSFAGDVQPIFTRSCATFGCHIGDVGAEASMNLAAGSAYAAIFDVDTEEYAFKRVVAGEPDQSAIYLKLLSNSEARGVGERMPKGRPNLSSRQIETIRVWIEEGALDN